MNYVGKPSLCNVIFYYKRWWTSIWEHRTRCFILVKIYKDFWHHVSYPWCKGQIRLTALPLTWKAVSCEKTVWALKVHAELTAVAITGECQKLAGMPHAKWRKNVRYQQWINSELDRSFSNEFWLYFSSAVGGIFMSICPSAVVKISSSLYAVACANTWSAGLLPPPPPSPVKPKFKKILTL